MGNMNGGGSLSGSCKHAKPTTTSSDHRLVWFCPTPTLDSPFPPPNVASILQIQSAIQSTCTCGAAARVLRGSVERWRMWALGGTVVRVDCGKATDLDARFNSLFPVDPARFSKSKSLRPLPPQIVQSYGFHHFHIVQCDWFWRPPR